MFVFVFVFLFLFFEGGLELLTGVGFVLRFVVLGGRWEEGREVDLEEVKLRIEGLSS